MEANPDYFARLLPQLADRSRSAVLSRLGFAHVPLYRHLHSLFSKPFGESGCFLADPTFEAVFGWETGNKRMGDLSGGLLSERLVEAMDNPPDQDDERCPEPDPKKRKEQHPYRFGRDRRPYQHQLESWEILAREVHQSLVVASGTGSGKTECFMVPILDRLVRQHAAHSGRLVGVRALFLYPLNALINSQRERLRAWTDFSTGDIRFCLYNGNTPEETKAGEKRLFPSEVMDRKTLRASPPPILVTNATMLEYMLVRSVDAPILEQSQGKLEWVVLDEAHSYIGSQAAELALLIRRVLHAFGVTPDQVRFVATSATIGDPEGEAGKKLKSFLADVAGVREERVHLVTGRRAVPPLPRPTARGQQLSLDELWRLDADARPDMSAPHRYAALTNHPLAWDIRRRFIGEDNKAKVATLSQACETLYGNAGPFSREQQIEALRWLDLLSGTRDGGGQPFLPLRAHLFHQTLSGIWACADPACQQRTGTALDDPAWPFGKVYLEPRQHCDCGSPVYELVACDDCGAPHLLAAASAGRLIQPQAPNALDEFELDNEAEEVVEEADVEEEDEQRHAPEIKTLVVNRPCLPETTGEEIIERQSRRFVDRPVEGETLRLVLRSDGGDGLTCPCCSGKPRQGRKLFQEARIGSPFALSYLLPTLLEFAPDERCKPIELPYRGRRLLTFNDSRQGTARMAARLQQESERSRVRGLVYHLALRKGTELAGAEAECIWDEITEYETLIGQIPTAEGRRIIEERLAKKRQQLSALTKPKPIEFDELARDLADQGDDFRWMLDHYRNDVSRESFDGSEGPLTLARLFLIREFGRRPKRLNNLESMGLVAVRYPDLEKVRSPHPPFTLEEWRDFLKIALDFFVRAGGSLGIDDPTRHWLGMKFPKTWLVERDRKALGRGERRWPRATYGSTPNLRSTLVRLLAHVLAVDLATPGGEDLVDAALAAAWKALTDESGILQSEAGGRRILPVKALAFSPITSAWVCPATRRILDTTLKGVTPYLPQKADDTTARCRPIDIPLYDRPFGGDADPLTQITRARRWIEDQQVIAELSEQGLWTLVNDRAVELAPYFTAAEHSAQQPSDRLGYYEKAFKNGKLNLLSCSTTMEMGIDIGGIAMVAMNNVPPHPANYLQRAGRAGRRQEGRSLAFTLCKSNPHDQIVFAKTDWPFVTPLPAPMVALNSRVIIQRHVNALVLAYFLKEVAAGSGQDAAKLPCGWFFTGEAQAVPVQRFIDRCQGYGIDDNLEQGLRNLLRNTALAAQAPARSLTEAGMAMEEARKRWLDEWDALCREEMALRGGSENPAYKAVTIQKNRMEGEYLLRELADQGFLPAYGFPTHIAAFDNLTNHQIKQVRHKEKGRDDNRFQRRELANRDSVMALREYAPGAQVVMDGLVYRSAGVTLNWKIPASETEVREIQAIKYAWHCKGCGTSGASRLLDEVCHCPECGAEMEGLHLPFLEPAGYAVDFYSDPHNDISTQDFIPVEPPWVSGTGDWIPLPEPRVGQFRVTTRGHIFHRSNGLHSKGYAICLECGRAEPMDAEGGKPKAFEKPHFKLRGDKKDRKIGEQREICPGSQNDWAIKTGITLGAESHTDVLEIQLANETGVWLTDKTTALSLAVALRDALAGLLGVQSDELGCDTKATRYDEKGKCRSILIYDRFAAGYASSAGRFIDRLFHEARKRLLCRDNPDTGARGCDSACPHCILDFDQRFAAESLNRHAALSFLTLEWLNFLKLPTDLAFFGECSCPEYADLDAALLREARASGIERIRLFGGGVGSDLGPSPLRHLAYRLAGSGYSVEVVIDRAGIGGLEEGDRYLLASLADHPQVQISRVASMPKVGSGWVVAELIVNAQACRWGVVEHVVSDGNWGDKRPLIFAAGLSPLDLNAEALTAQQLRPLPLDRGDREISIHQELDGKLQGFGERLWGLVAEQHPATRAFLSDQGIEVRAIRYHDRYLFTPLAVALLINLVEGLRDTLGTGRWPDPEIIVTTTAEPSPGDRRPARYLWSEWPDLTLRDAAIENGFDYIGMRARVIALHKRDTEHGRILEIDLSTGAALQARFDQGVSYWRIAQSPSLGRRATTFDFSADEIAQAEVVTQLDARIEGTTHPTQLFLRLQKSSSS